MPQRSKKPESKAKRERKRARARKLRTTDLEQHQVFDLRDPRVRAELRREGKLLALHPENAEIDVWIEAVYDWSEWPEWSE